MGKPGKRTRRMFSDEFKTETVRLVRDSGKSVGAIAAQKETSTERCDGLIEVVGSRSR